MPGLHNDIDERSADTTTVKTLIIGEGIAAYRVKDDYIKPSHYERKWFT